MSFTLPTIPDKAFLDAYRGGAFDAQMSKKAEKRNSLSKGDRRETELENWWGRCWTTSLRQPVIL